MCNIYTSCAYHCRTKKNLNVNFIISILIMSKVSTRISHQKHNIYAHLSHILIILQKMYVLCLTMLRMLVQLQYSLMHCYCYTLKLEYPSNASTYS